jgi:hypothetical protein
MGALLMTTTLSRRFPTVPARVRFSAADSPALAAHDGFMAICFPDLGVVVARAVWGWFPGLREIIIVRGTVACEMAEWIRHTGTVSRAVITVQGGR